MKEKVYLLIPLYNEAKQIAKTLASIKEEGYKNFILIDDGSLDATQREIQNFKEQNKDTIILYETLHKNLGVGYATNRGFDIARKHGIEYVITFDGDGQHLASDIKNVLAPFKQFEDKLNEIVNNNSLTQREKDAIIYDLNRSKTDVVIGSRFKDYKVMSKKIPIQRVIFNKIGNIITYLLFGLYVSDSQTGFKAFSKGALNKIKLKTTRYEFCSEIISKIKTEKLKFEEVPISVLYTTYSINKGQNLFEGFKTLGGLIKYRISLFKKQ